MMDLKNKVKLPEWFTAGAVFVYYWILSLYKLLEAPIWGDECMEFYCSITTQGAIRGVTNYATMYERMARIQQQPPLYNWLMCVWLKISEAPFWYRFSSVIMGFGAMLGVYFLVKKLYGKYVAAVSVLVVSSIYHIQYYVKEASEYILLLCILVWAFYVYVLIFEKVNLKRIVTFVFLCIAAMYTHYGAIMVVVPMACQMLFFLWRSKEWVALRQIIIAYVSAVIVAGVPLILFFFVPQSNNIGSTFKTDNPISFVGDNMIADFLDSMMIVLRWSLIDFGRDGERFHLLLWMLTFFMLFGGIIVCFITKKRAVRNILSCGALTYVIYYLLTSYNYYAYGIFGNRYNYFLMPIIILSLLCILCELIETLKNSNPKLLKITGNFVQILVIIVMLCYTAYGSYRVHCHWDKRNERDVVAAWYEREEKELPTYVCYWSKFAFVYHMTHDERYSEDVWDNMYLDLINQDTDYHTEADWINYLQNEAYPDGIPEKFYVVAGNYNDEVEILQTLGYTIEPIFDGTAKLFLATAPFVQ